MKFPSVFISVCLMLLANNSFAVQSNQVDVAQWIPWPFISSEIQKIQLPTHTAIATWDLQWQEWKPRALGADVQFQGKLSQLQVNENGVSASAEKLSLQISIQQLMIDQIVDENLNGNIIQIHVQAQCLPLQLQIHNFSMSAKAPFVRQGEVWGPHLSDLQIDLPEGSWSTSAVHCQGPQGLDQVLSQHLNEALKDPKSLQALIREWLTPQLDQMWQQKWEQLTGKAWQALHVQSMSDPEAQGFFLLGGIDLANGPSVPLSINDKLNLSGLAPQLVLSQEGFAALVKENVSSLGFENFDLRQIPGFQRLMRSRFLQFFLWPDLMKFAKSAGFFLSTNPKYTKLNISPISNGDAGYWALQLQAAGNIRGERDNELRNYINWGIGMSGNLTTEVKNSQLRLTTTNTQTNLNWEFDSKYIASFNPKTRIADSVINAAKSSLFENHSFIKALPVLSWQDQEFKLNGWNQQGSLILLNWTK